MSAPIAERIFEAITEYVEAVIAHELAYRDHLHGRGDHRDVTGPRARKARSDLQDTLEEELAP